jgi:hypothetical protein
MQNGISRPLLLEYDICVACLRLKCRRTYLHIISDCSVFFFVPLSVVLYPPATFRSQTIFDAPKVHYLLLLLFQLDTELDWHDADLA